MLLNESTRRLEGAIQGKKMCLVRSEDVRVVLTELTFLDTLTTELGRECEELRKKLRVAVSHGGE